MKLSTLTLSLIAALGFQAAQAGTITVIVDDFNAPGARPFVINTGTFTFGVVDPSSGAPLLAPGEGVFSLSAGSLIGGTGTLTYAPGVTLPTNAYLGSLSYDMVFSNLGNPNTALNTVELNGAPTAYGYVGGPGGNPTINTAVDYTSGANIVLNFIDNRAVSWDIALDNIKVTFQCNGAEDQKFGSIGAFSRGSVSCVPVPGSMGLLGLGGLALAFAARRRKSV